MNALDVLLAPDLEPNTGLGWSLRAGYCSDLVRRMHELTREVDLLGARVEADLPDYVTALHALVLELADVTGSATSGRRTSAWLSYIEALRVRWSA